MSIEFLKRLFTSCSDEVGDNYQDGLNLCELYEHLEEVEEARGQLRAVCEDSCADKTAQDELLSASYGFAFACELQGFINGFRLCAMLGKEIDRKETAV